MTGIHRVVVFLDFSRKKLTLLEYLKLLQEFKFLALCLVQKQRYGSTNHTVFVPICLFFYHMLQMFVIEE